MCFWRRVRSFFGFCFADLTKPFSALAKLDWISELRLCRLLLRLEELLLLGERRLCLLPFRLEDRRGVRLRLLLPCFELRLLRLRRVSFVDLLRLGLLLRLELELRSRSTGL